MTATTGRSRRYGTEARKRRVHEKGRRRRAGRPSSAATAVPSGTWLLVNEIHVPGRLLLLVQRERDVVAGDLGRLLDGRFVGEDPGQHRAEDVPILHVDPVLRSRNEPASASGALVYARSEEARRVRDVALRPEGGHRRVVGERADPGDGLGLVGADGHREVGAAEEARNGLALRPARHHELRRRALVIT